MFAKTHQRWEEENYSRFPTMKKGMHIPKGTYGKSKGKYVLGMVWMEAFKLIFVSQELFLFPNIRKKLNTMCCTYLRKCLPFTHLKPIFLIVGFLCHFNKLLMHSTVIAIARTQ